MISEPIANHNISLSEFARRINNIRPLGLRAVFIWVVFIALFAVVEPIEARDRDSAQGAPIVIGHSHAIKSAVMGDTRTVNIYLPPSYASGNQRYPVLYLLDGGTEQDFHHISGLAQLASVNGATQELIVIGIETRDRRRELAFSAIDPRYSKEWPTHGRAADFRRYIASEVVPFVERTWRTKGPKALMGESLAGLFVIDVMLHEPALFDHYIAVDPSLWWDNGSLAARAPELARKASFDGRTLWLATATPQVGTDELVTVLRRDAPALELTLSPRPKETHATIYHPAAYDALRALYTVPPIPDGECPWWFCENPAARSSVGKAE